MNQNQNNNENMKTGIELIAQERQRQIEKEGWTAQHDAEHVYGELSAAAECYLLELRARNLRGEPAKRPPPAWPWHRDWWKPSGDPIKNLVKAGALIAAEIDRLNALVVRPNSSACGQCADKVEFPSDWTYCPGCSKPLL